MSKEEFCIMSDNPPRWRNFRYDSECHRHEVFFGKNRKKSIEDGLIVFLRPQDHNMSEYGVHFNLGFDKELKQEGQRIWQEHYGKSTEEFIKRYGKNYL